MKEEANQPIPLEGDSRRSSNTPPVHSKVVVAEVAERAEKKHTRKRKYGSEQRYSGMAAAIPLIIWTAQPDGYVNYYNPRWFDYTGLTFEQTRGWGWQVALHPDDRQMCVERWQKAVRTGEPYEIEYRFRRADGVYRWHLGRALPVRDAQQQIISWVGSDTDIDGQKRAEEELRIRARQQAAVAELGQCALRGMDLPDLFEDVLLMVNETLYVEYSSIAERLDDGTMHARVRSKNGITYQIVKEWKESQTSYTLATKEPVIVNDFRTEGRFSVPAEIIYTYGIVGGASVIIEGHTNPFAVLIVHTKKPRVFTQDDIYFLQSVANVVATAMERKQAEMELAQAMSALQVVNEQLEHANKAQSAFVSIVSHEFRSTLTSIQGFSELMRDEEFSFSEIREYANDINTDARRLSRMINELLDLNRMKSGRMLFNSEYVDINRIIMDVVDRTRTNSLAHRISLQLDDQLPLLPGDADKLTQVITNLLSNAFKYSPNGGDIVLHSKLEGELVHVWVQDQGVGIPANALEQIFEPYSRIASGETRYIEGTGIGLTIVRQIIQLHGGKVWAESTPGQGSVFHFTLPLQECYHTM
jgi:PAS domain S-box-containing protein